MRKSEDINKLFPSFEKELLSEIYNKTSLRTLREGEVLMRTGQYLRSVLLVISGLIKVYREDEEGGEYFMYYLQPGQACALSMICASCQMSSELKAVVVEEAEVITIPLEYMDTWMNTYRSWYYFVLDSYRARFQELLLTIDNIAFKNMDERLLFYLRRQIEITGGNLLTINYTEIAQELNSSREVISRLMKKLAENGSVELLKNQQLRVLHLDYK